MNCLKCKGKASNGESTQNNFTIETKVLDERNGTRATIEFVNESRFQSIRNVRQLKDSQLNSPKNIQTITERMQLVIDLINGKAEELQRESKAQKSPDELRTDYYGFLMEVVKQLRGVMTEKNLPFPLSSTPYCAERRAESRLQSSSKFELSFTVFISPHDFLSRLQSTAALSTNHMWIRTDQIYRWAM